MGCFETLPIPWRKAADLGGDAGPAHLEENFRMIDQWANPLNLSEDCQGGGGCPDNARANAGYFGGVVGAGSILYFDDTTLGGGGSSVDVGGDLTYDGTTGAFTVVRAGLYICSMQVFIDGTALANPYWVQLIGPGADTRLIAPYNTSLPYVLTQQVYVPAAGAIKFGIANNLTASSAITFSLATITVSESPCSTIT